MGSSNVLVHLRHHHPSEHARIVDILARRQLEAGAGGNKQKPEANVVIKSEPETEHIEIKVEVEEDID